MSETKSKSGSIKEFLGEMCVSLGKCECGNPKCKSIMFGARGKSGFDYIIDYESTEAESSNILISTKEKSHVVFNGRCENEHDIAQVLRMVVI